ncbi:MAG TPA: hypothetical protein VED01_07085 [Burkholderiales bacterium]|nr:hypothetical protein [Burkholderiales bacterium]
MKTGLAAGLTACAGLVVSSFPLQAFAGESKPLRVISDHTAGGFQFPESAAYDPRAKVFYVSQFGGSKLDPAAKDGQGKISKVALDGKVIEERFLPAAGETMNKPKGIWVKANRLWVTDIDSVWIFDLKTKKGRKLDIPGITFANDPTVIGTSLYVSDNRADRLYRIEPADFLNANIAPQISIPLAGRSIYPNGVHPGKRGEVLIVGFQSPKEPRGIYSLTKDGELRELAKGLGRLDGVYQLRDGSLLVTDWNSGSLSRWTEKGGMEKLAAHFKGPADFATIEDGKGVTVAVPDLPGSQLRIIRLSR